MVARARLLQARVLPHGWLDALRQVSLFAAAYLAYRLVRGIVETQANIAFAHARDLISLERGLHLFVEPSIQAWASGSHAVMLVASWWYINAQTTITVAALIYLYLRHNQSFYFVRNMLMIGMAMALIGYVAFPTAPPRFMPEWGFIDTVSDFTGLHVSSASASANALTNLYAAVPVDARRLRDHDRLDAGTAGQTEAAESPLVALPVDDDLRDHRHGQPLHLRRACSAH